MDLQVISSQEMVKPELNSPQHIKVLIGSDKNFKGVPEPGDYYNRPLMVSTWTQTNSQDFSLMHELILKDLKSEREKKLEEKIKLLEQDLKAHTKLLSQIHATSARTSALLQQQQTQDQSNLNNGLNSDTNIIYNNKTDLNNSSIIYANNNNALNNTTPASSFNTAVSTQISPKIVNALNTTKRVSSSPAESVKYRIIAEGTGNNNSDEPIEIQLAEEDGALNLNSSADSGRLEICLAPEENVEIINECNNIIMESKQSMAGNLSEPTTSSDHKHFIKKRKLAADRFVSSTTSSNKDEEQLSVASVNNSMPEQTPNEKRRCSRNSLLKTPKIKIKNFSNSMDSQVTPSAQSTNGNYSTPQHKTSIDLDNFMVSIGPNNTQVPAKVYENLKCTSASLATRKLLMAVFDRKVLATHSMTGKPSPAFKDHDKPVKEMLDPRVIADIIHAVTHKCNASDKEVRNAITTKCADENKMMKLKINKRTPMREINKENING